jgi:hypothetical protein
LISEYQFSLFYNTFALFHTIIFYEDLSIILTLVSFQPDTLIGLFHLTNKEKFMDSYRKSKTEIIFSKMGKTNLVTARRSKIRLMMLILM